MLHFREVSFNIFHLLDGDHDNMLRVLAVDQDLDFEYGDVDDQFWSILKKSLHEPNSKQAIDWLASIAESFRTDVDLHSFQKIMWNELEQTHVNIDLLYENAYK